METQARRFCPRAGRLRRRAATLGLWAAAAALPVSAVYGQHGGQRRGISNDVEVAGLLDEIEAQSAARERIDRQVGELSGQQDALRQSLHRHVRALYRVTRAGRAPLQGGFDAVLRHVSRVKRLRRLVVSEAERLGSLSHRSRALRAESGKIALTLERARERLHEVQEHGASALASPDERFEGVFSSRGGYQRTQQSFYGLRVVDPLPTESFAALRGQLASPISGEVRVVEARRPESDGPGLEFQAPPGTPVRAVAAGRVAFSDRYGSYGRIVILDHGDGYYTVYGGLGGIEVRVGDDLSRRARIGSIGSDFSPTALFFEVRHGTRTLPPHDWLGY